MFIGDENNESMRTSAGQGAVPGTLRGVHDKHVVLILRFNQKLFISKTGVKFRAHRPKPLPLSGQFANETAWAPGRVITTLYRLLHR